LGFDSPVSHRGERCRSAALTPAFTAERPIPKGASLFDNSCDENAAALDHDQWARAAAISPGTRVAHPSASVPGWAASHGCPRAHVRIWRGDRIVDPARRVRFPSWAPPSSVRPKAGARSLGGRGERWDASVTVNHAPFGSPSSILGHPTPKTLEKNMQ
jgi:hypothetical protein